MTLCGPNDPVRESCLLGSNSPTRSQQLRRFGQLLSGRPLSLQQFSILNFVEPNAAGCILACLYAESRTPRELKMVDIRRLYSTFYLVLTIGVTWAALSQDRVNYPSWALVGPAQFNAFHRASLSGLIRTSFLSLCSVCRQVSV
jgi:hypothetical protein